jgi:hypothetical protein
MEQAAAPAAAADADIEDIEDDFPNASQQEDGPTMAVLSPALEGPLRDDLLNPRLSRLEDQAAGRPEPSPLGEPAHDKHSAMGSVAGDEPRLPASQQQRPALPVFGDDSEYQEEPTRTVARDELMRHQDAAFVVADGAMGDEATLAVAPGKIDLGPAAAGIAAAMQEALGPPREPSHADHAPPFSPFDAPPQFPPPGNTGGPHGHPPTSPAHSPYGHAEPQQQPPPWHGDGLAYGGPPSQGMPPSNQGMPSSHQGMQPPQGMPYQQGMPSQQGMQPPQGMQGMQPPQGTFGMPPQAHAMGSYPATGQQPIPPSYQGQPSMGPSGGQADWGQHAGPSSGQYPGQGGMAAPPQQAPWMQPQPMQQGGGASRLTPQILLLIVVGGVCLAIFVTGIVLFLTTKF